MIGRFPDLAGRVAVVTGGSRGIGEAVSRGLAENGARTYILARQDQGTLDAVVQGLVGHGSVHGILADLTDSGQVAGVFARVAAESGGIDILVNNAGGLPAAVAMTEITDDAWQRMLAVNLTSAFYCCRAVLPHMLSRGWGRVINVASEAARTPPHVTGAHYAAAKAGLIGLTKHMAREYAAYGITVNVVAPGTTLTERRRRMQSPAQLEGSIAGIPLGRLAQPEEPAAAILFLASAGAGYMTGAVLDVNGGRSMNS